MIRSPRRRLNSQAGFTVVEMMVASLVFAIILGVITSGIVHFTTDYYKGINSSATQRTARDVITLISQNFSYSTGVDAPLEKVAPNGYDRAYCVGNILIDYALGVQPGMAPGYGVFISPWDKTDAGCKPYTSGLTGKEVLAPKMRLTDLSVKETVNASTNGISTRLYTIIAGVAYGDDDLLCSSNVAGSAYGGCDRTAPPLTTALSGQGLVFWDKISQNGADVRCKSGSGSQFCAVSHLSTEVVTRF